MIVSSKSHTKTLSGGLTLSTEGVSFNADRVGLVFCCLLPRAFPFDGVDFVAVAWLDVFGDIDNGDCGECAKPDGVPGVSDGLSGIAAMWKFWLLLDPGELT